MEHVTQEIADATDLYVGSPSDHFRLARSHLWRGVRLLLCPGSAVTPRKSGANGAGGGGPRKYK